MNREIKFRAWYENSQTFVYFTWGVPFSDEGLKVYSDLCINGAKWEQYTGLKDCNGKEIYEGDILQNTEEGDDSKGKIVFQRGCFLFWYEGWKDKNLGPIEFDEIKQAYFEVIGNIYQNPELTEKL